MKQIDSFLDFLLFEKGESITVGLLPRRALVTDASRYADQYFNDKKIRTKQSLSTGDLVSYQDEHWMLVSQVDISGASYTGRIRKINHNTKFIINDWLYEFPSILEMVSLSIGSAVDIRIATGNMRITLQNNEITSQIAINNRFIASLSAWKVIGLDYTKTGLIIMTAERDLFEADDDIENGIANGYSLPTWSISLQPTTLTLAPEATATIEATLLRNSTAQSGAAFLWHSSDAQIATVTDGLVTGVAEGEAAVTARWQTHPTIQASADISVVDTPPVIITYAFYSTATDGSDKTYTDFDIIHTDTRNIGIEKRINGVIADINDTYVFTFYPNGATSNNYTYTVLNTYSIQLKNKQVYTKPVTLSAVSNETGESLSVSFYLKSMF